jgi:dienelactone hydrolase
MRSYVLATVLIAFCFLARSAAIDPLRNTAPLDWPEEDLSGRMMDGAHRFVEAQIAQARENRLRYWKFDAARSATWGPIRQENWDQFRAIIGAVDKRLEPRMERFGDDNSPALVAETGSYRVFQVRWSVLDGLSAEGLLVQPITPGSAHVVVVPDCNQTPEQVLGLSPGLAPEQQFARRLAENGCQLIIPVLIERKPLETDDPQIQRSNQTAREWLYRQAYHMGRHPIGYEVQKVLAAVDWFRSRHGDGNTIGVVGYGNGGQIALYAAALGPIDVTVISGYFGPREQTWSEPLDRNLFGLLNRFEDAAIASFIYPRLLRIEHAEIPAFDSPKGAIKTPEGNSVRSEFGRIGLFDGPRVSGSFPPRRRLIIGDSNEPVGPLSDAALAPLMNRDDAIRPSSTPSEPPRDRRLNSDPRERQRRAIADIERHVQSLVRSSEHTREKFFLYKVLPELENKPWSTDKTLPTQTAEKFIEAAKPFREKFQREAMGKFDVEYLPLNPRSRKVVETDKWTAWDVVLDVWPDVFAWGLLVVPKDIKEGERRPVVVCQHGRNGVPRDCLDRHSTAYNDFAAKLAERGFITFAPHNLYRGEDRYRWLNRKANTIGCTLFSFIIGQHERILDWLGMLPYVDADRIAFYGLSYGGETAVRVPTVLDKYCLSICSGDFNQWTTKVAATDQPFSFMRTIEWEMPYWNLGQTFDYAEMAYLMVPRPFMVERGHLDRVGRDPWVAHEYAKVRFLYAQLGLADKTEIEYFQGGHSINGQGTFAFLHEHLRWPAPEDR